MFVKRKRSSARFSKESLLLKLINRVAQWNDFCESVRRILLFYFIISFYFFVAASYATDFANCSILALTQIYLTDIP